MMFDLCEADEVVTDQPGWVKVNGQIIAATKTPNSIEYRGLGGRKMVASDFIAKTFSYDGGRDCE